VELSRRRKGEQLFLGLILKRILEAPHNGSRVSPDQGGERVTPQIRNDSSIQPEPNYGFEFPIAFPVLTEAQLGRLRSYGVAQTVTVGDVLYSPGDHIDGLIVTETAEVDIVLVSTRGDDDVLIVRHGPGRFVGEMNLLTGQTFYLTARVSKSGGVHRIPPDRFRRLMAEDDELSDIILAAFGDRRRLLRQLASASLEILGHSSSAESFALRRYVERQGIPHSWYDETSDQRSSMMAGASLVERDLPAVIVGDAVLKHATPGHLAEHLGLTYRKRPGRVDLTVIGAGPAGLAAAVYGASEGLDTILLDSVSPGGQAAASSRIENYIGFPSGLSGSDLTGRAVVQALKFGAQLNSPCAVVHLGHADGKLRVTLDDGATIDTQAVIIATGAQYRALPLPRWNEFESAGIYYATTELEARACVGQPVTVVGGANSAGQAALFMASRGSQVTVVIRGSDVRAGMSTYLVDRLLAHEGITVRTSTEVTRLEGSRSLDAITLTNRISGETIDQACKALFCFIGATPATSWCSNVLVDKSGFVLTDVQISSDHLGPEWAALGRTPLPFETNVPGVFAAGDVRKGSMKRVAAAVGEGASAVASVHAAASHLIAANG
jgi:thioredoxin reductase (NADPH)